MSTRLAEGDRTTQLAAESLLRDHRDALVCGLSSNGLIVPIPGRVALSGQVAIEGRAVPDVVVAADRGTVFELWQRVQEEGAVQGRVRLLSKPSRWMTIHLLDLRRAHEVLLCVILPSKEAAEPGGDADELPPAAPRFATVMEDELGKVLGCDDAFAQMFGYTTEEVIGKSVLDQITPMTRGAWSRGGSP